MTKSLFHSAAVRLTAWYLALVMLISVSLSIALYQISSNELRQSIQQQITFYSSILGPTDLENLTQLRQDQLDDDLHKLRQRLTLFNIFVFVGGGAASYGLSRRTMRPLEKSLEAQTRFTGDASHELRTPLAIMQSEIEIALRRSDLTKSQAIDLLKSNLEETIKLKTLSDGLLALASDDSALDTKEPFDTKEIINQAVERVSKQAANRQVKFIVVANEISGRGSSQYLTDALVVLLDNAIKYSSVGGTVTVRSEKKDRSVRFSVIDKGSGIKSDELPKIFERFYRSDVSRSRDDVGGYGLGLPIALKIAELHHGSIEVKSIAGKGSTFTLRIPV